MKSFLDCWIEVATTLFSQALTGEPVLEESLPKPMAPGSFGFEATISGDETGRFVILLDATILDSTLVGEGVDQKNGWREILQETVGAACGELQAKTGKNCKVEKFEETDGESKVSRAFQLKAGDNAWTIMVRDEVRVPKVPKVEAAKPEATQAQSSAPQAAAPPPPPPPQPSSAPPSAVPSLTPGIELLLDVELEASLRFGCREMLLGDILNLGPGDVVQLDRHVADPVDLVVGDKIVARGEVVLVNGNFGLRVTEVAAPRKRLESIRCLF
jgi:flagellar motor switch protein FliN